MAGGTADDEKGERERAQGNLGLPGTAGGDHPVQPPGSAGPGSPPLSEWTVSDRRGPLNAAVPGDDVERFVPGSETDTVGAHDRPTPARGEPIADAGPIGGTMASTSAPHDPPEATPNRITTVDPEVSLGAAHEVDPDEADPAKADPEPEPGHVPEHATNREPDGGTDHAPAATAPAGASMSAAPPPPGDHGPARTPPASRSFVPLALGIVVGALIGAGSAALVYTEYAAPDATDRVDPGRFAALSSRVDAFDKRPDPQPTLAAMKRQLDDLAGKVAVLDKRPGVAAPAIPVSAASPARPSAPNASSPGGAGPATPTASTQPAGEPALGAKVAALQASLETLQKQNAASRDVAGKLDALQAAVAGAQTLATTARTGVDSLKSQQQTLDGKIGALQTAVGSAQKQASAAQSGVDAVQTEQKTLAGKLGAPALAVVADSLVEQIASGKPYAMQVDALTSLGADPTKVAVLRENAGSGVPSAQTLLGKFKPLADPIVATETKAPANAGFGERLKHGLFGLVSVRRADETTGSDLSSRVALIEADLAHNDVPGAYAVWTALSADARQRSDAWGASAKTSAEAINAAHALQTESIGSLAAKKS